MSATTFINVSSGSPPSAARFAISSRVRTYVASLEGTRSSVSSATLSDPSNVLANLRPKWSTVVDLYDVTVRYFSARVATGTAYEIFYAVTVKSHADRHRPPSRAHDGRSAAGRKTEPTKR